MTYGITLVGGDIHSKIDALNEAVRQCGALPYIELVEWPDLEDCIVIGDAPAVIPEPKRITFKLERTVAGLQYIEQENKS